MNAPPASGSGVPASGGGAEVSSFRVQLASLSSGGSGVAHRDLADRYRGILEQILTLGEDQLVDGLKCFIEAIINENVSLVISRQLLGELVSNHLVKMQDSVSKAASHFTLEIVQPRVISFEDQVCYVIIIANNVYCIINCFFPSSKVGAIRQHLADIYEREQSWKQAAEVLVGIPLETGNFLFGKVKSSMKNIF